MEQDLIKFNSLIKEINKDVCYYEDEKGNYFLIPTGKLTCICEYKELDDAEYKLAMFNKEIDKNIKLTKQLVNRQVDKYSITNNKKDQGTIIDKEVEVSRVWYVRNGLGLVKSFSNKEKALSYAKEINDKYLKIAEVVK